jgi:hypothetical protein
MTVEATTTPNVTIVASVMGSGDPMPKNLLSFGDGSIYIQIDDDYTLMSPGMFAKLFTPTTNT